jgi:hypothetical protein
MMTPLNLQRICQSYSPTFLEGAFCEGWPYLRLREGLVLRSQAP